MSLRTGQILPDRHASRTCPIDLKQTLAKVGLASKRGIDPMEWFIFDRCEPEIPQPGLPLNVVGNRAIDAMFFIWRMMNMNRLRHNRHDWLLYISLNVALASLIAMAMWYSPSF
jgi:hypothetical protein